MVPQHCDPEQIFGDYAIICPAAAIEARTSSVSVDYLTETPRKPSNS